MGDANYAASKDDVQTRPSPERSVPFGGTVSVFGREIAVNGVTAVREINIRLGRNDKLKDWSIEIKSLATVACGSQVPNSRSRCGRSGRCGADLKFDRHPKMVVIWLVSRRNRRNPGSAMAEDAVRGYAAEEKRKRLVGREEQWPTTASMAGIQPLTHRTKRALSGALGKQVKVDHLQLGQNR
jgi:hypothetical protein